MYRTAIPFLLAFLASTHAFAQTASDSGRLRTYYIAADEVDWDYLPGGRDLITDRPYADSTFYQDGTARPASTVYRKALFREYTDGTFQTLKPRSPEWGHLGFLGPVIHAEVGDTIGVVFRNNASRPYTMHPHGVFYDKASEGAPYSDGTTAGDKDDDGVPPGGIHTYVWPVPERAGPGPGEGSSVMWMYHSHAHEVQDINSGLLGVMIVTRRGMARPDGSPRDVDRELVATFAQVHEENSWYADENLGEALAAGPPAANPSQLQNFYPNFVLFTINGYIRGTMPLESMTVKTGERVRWYVMSSTNDFDFHTPHWHGNTVTAGGMRMDVVQVAPMAMMTADMVPDNPGTWLFHCHISFHNEAGMAVRFRVE